MHRPSYPLPRRAGWLLPVLAIVLVAGHGIILAYVSSHVMLSVAVLAAALVVLVIMHVALPGPLLARFRRWRSGRRGGEPCPRE